MLIRVHPSMAVLYATHQARPEDLKGLQWTAAAGLYRYVADLDLVVCGPLYWFYYGMNGRSGSQFTLEAALPVHGKIPTALLPFFKQIPAFRCLSSCYEGSPEGLSLHQDEMRQHMKENGLKMNGIYAERFLHLDPENQGCQQVEALIGISS